MAMYTITVQLADESDYDAVLALLKSWEEGDIGLMDGFTNYRGDASYIGIDPPEGDFGVETWIGVETRTTAR
jgi:hypothetical protein